MNPVFVRKIHVKLHTETMVCITTIIIIILKNITKIQYLECYTQPTYRLPPFKEIRNTIPIFRYEINQMISILLTQSPYSFQSFKCDLLNNHIRIFLFEQHPNCLS